MKNLVCLTVFASFFFLSCSSNVDSIGDENLGISTKKSSVILSNNSDKIINYIVIESETATLIDLDPNAEWPSIEAGAQVSIPYGEIMGYRESSKEAIIMWGIEGSNSGNSQTFKL